MENAPLIATARRVMTDELGTPWLREAVAAGLVVVISAPPLAVRKHRLSMRDEAIREAGHLAPSTAAFANAQKIARDLDRYLATSWRADRVLGALPGDTDPWRQILHRIAILNDGRSIGWRQIMNIFAGGRGR